MRTITRGRRQRAWAKFGSAIALTGVVAGGQRVAADTYAWQTAGATDNWNTIDANWLVNGGVTPAAWTDGNAAVFDAATGETVTIDANVAPTAVVVGPGTGNWTLTGAGQIANAAGYASTLTKTGAGTLTLSGANGNTYTGGTYLTAGGIRVGGTSATLLGTGALTFNGDASFGAVTNARTIANAMVLNPTVTATFDTSGAALTLTGAISGAGKVTRTGGNDLILVNASSYSGGTSLGGGGVVRIAASDLALGTGAIAFTGSTTLATSNVSGSGARTLLNPIGVGSGVTASFDGGYFTLTLAGPITGAGNVAKTSSGTVVLAGNNTYTGTTTTGAGAGTLQVGNGGSTTAATATGNLGSGSVTIGLATNVLAFSRTDAVAVGNAISGPGQLTQAGTGTTTYTGTGTYTGATNVNAGTFDLNGSLTSAIVVASGARLGSSAGTGVTTGAITLNDGSYVLAGANAVKGTGVTVNSTTTPNVNVLVSGAPTGAPATVDVIKYGTGTLTSVSNFRAGVYRGGTIADDAVNQKVTLTYTANALTWNTGTGTWDVGTTANFTGSADSQFFWGDSVAFGNPAANAVVTVGAAVAPSAVTLGNASAMTITNGTGGSIVGTGSLAKSGAGTLTMTGTAANAFSGGTTISGGTLALGTGGTGGNTSSPAALGTGTVTINSTAILKLWIQNSTTFAVTNNLAVDNGRILAEDGIYNLTGNVAIGAGGMSIGAKWSGKTVNLAGNVSGGTLTEVAETTGSGAINTTVFLTGPNNTYGATTITSGLLSVGNGGVSGSLGAGDVTLGGTAAALRFNRAGELTVDNRITGTGSTSATIPAVANGGSGVVTLTNTANDYTGPTYVTAGTLLVTGNLTASNVTVTGGTFGGTGAVTNSVTVNAAGSLSAGLAAVAIGTLSAGPTTLAGTGVFDLGTPGASTAAPGLADLVAVTGNLTLGGALSFRDNALANGQGSLGIGTYRLFTYTGTLTNNAPTLAGPSGYAYALDTGTPGSVYLTVSAVPEPGAGALVALAAASVAGRRRRRRRRAD